MPWTFGNDPKNSIRDRVRILIGDTLPTEPLLDDNILDWLIETEQNELLAAAKAADVLSARFSREADLAVGELSVKLSRRAVAFFELAQRLRAGAVGPIEAKPVLAREEPREPLFRLGQFEVGR